MAKFEPTQRVWITAPALTLGHIGPIHGIVEKAGENSTQQVCVKTAIGVFLIGLSDLHATREEAIDCLIKRSNEVVEFRMPPITEREKAYYDKLLNMDVLPATPREVVGVATSDSRVVGMMINGKPIYEVEVAVDGPTRFLSPWDKLEINGICREEVTPDSVIVIEYPTGQPSPYMERLTDCVTQIAAGIQRPVILMPSGCDFTTLSLDELRAAREKLNEVIYDKEKAAT